MSDSKGTNGKLTGARYWKSLDGYADQPGFNEWLEGEFPEGASLAPNGVERRGFMKLMAASFGLAGIGITGCRRPEQAIMPYGRAPENVIPGIPSYFTTSLPGAHGNQPLVVESHQFRPTKVEGNPSYTPAGGASDVYAQAGVLDLYDPDRSKDSFRRVETGEDKTVSWKKVSKAEVEKELKELLAGEGKVAVLANKSSSPSRGKLASTLREKGVLWAEYEAIDFSGPEKALGSALGLDGGLRVVPKLDAAKRILSIDSDFLSCREPNELVNNRGFSKGRKVLDKSDAKKMNRLYSVEADLTRAGAAADHRLRLAPSQMVSFANALAAELLGDAPAEVAEQLKTRGAKCGVDPKWVKEAAKDLAEHKGEALVLAGNHLPAEAQVLVYTVNQALGAPGKTVEYLETPADESKGIADLASALEAGEITTLIFLGGNPVYAAPGSLDWQALLKKVEKTVRFGVSLDETSSLSDLHVAASHYLETWGDGLTWDQSAYLPVQPLLAPLFNTFSELDFLALLAGDSKDSHALIQATFKERAKGVPFDDFLRKGVLEQKIPVVAPELALTALAEFKESVLPAAPSEKALDLFLTPDFHTWDGRYANNGWMQECPEPMSKLTWDNAILVSPVLARELEAKHKGLRLLPKPTMLNENGTIAPDTAVFDQGRQDAPVVRLKLSEDAFIEGPLHVQPGLADYALVASLGMGRTTVGRVGEGAGFSAYPLLGVDGSRIVSGLSLVPVDGKRGTLANVQEHWSMEGRAIVRETTVNGFEKDESFAAKMGAESHSPRIFGHESNKSVGDKAISTPRGYSAHEHPDHVYENSDVPGLHQWGMSIDLNLCTGCNACVVACQSENNIPVVGKDQVLRGREMHWIRLDRYFSSTEREGAEIPSDVQVNFQGVACMHCETAPCEQVCPFNATVHDEEGLNSMAYNRCGGTRYCANNCPYKVRRFNFFDWNKRRTDELYDGPLGEKNPELANLGKNPDVTVRMRGVMEKCTYCVQRIQESKIRTKVNAQREAKFASGEDGAALKVSRQDLKVPDGTIKTACQQVCSADAIVFGDVSDPDSEVSKLKNNPRDYALLGYLNLRPRTSYLARVRNPNPAMPDKYRYDKPHSYMEYKKAAYPAKDKGNGKESR